MNANSQSKHRFHYHASAHALSGQFWRPFQRVIEVQAPSVLPSIGGIGSSRVDNFRLDDFVSFKAGYTHVLGSEMEVKDEKGVILKDANGQPRIAHTTQVTSTVEGLNILDVITADRIVGRLTSVHDPADDKARGEARILLIGSRFENLRIAGCNVDVSLHHELFLKLPTLSAIEDLEKKHADKFWELATETLDAVKPGARLEKKKPEAPGALLCSIIKDVNFKCLDEGEKVCPGVTRRGHRFHVEDFGNIYLGEMLFRHSHKTLTMVRIELGSPNGAGIIVVQADSNGQPPW
jgi:hypothetical protein